MHAPEMDAADRTTQRCDVAILGGGLAGLTLAVQLHRQDPDLQISVLERRSHPVPDAAFKVGESTVEIGAHYLADVLGLREHLEREQIRKFGFRFFFSEGSHAIAGCTELGVSRLLPTPSWQIDRGRFENFLGQHARVLGVSFLDGTIVRGIELSRAVEERQDAHRITYQHGEQILDLHARWVVDASGRAGLIKRKQSLARSNDHNVNAVWWRVDGVVDPQHWSDDIQWRTRCTPPDRWRSTNHLCGPGYWVWLIPLASGAHSIGIVCDAVMHPLETMNTHARAMTWLRAHQPQLADTLDRPEHALRDFLFLRHFSYGCDQVFSEHRWALTGEAGLFLDPFYSPGTDFIAIANTYVCELIARDRAGLAFAQHAALYQQLFFSFYDNTLTLYQDQYPLFGDAQVMPIKVIWDYTYYWAVLAPLFFAGKLTDLSLFGRLRPQLERASALNLAMQPLLRHWGERNRSAAAPSANGNDGRLLDQYQIGWFREMNRALADQLDDAALLQRIADNVTRMRWLAQEILTRAHVQYPDIDGAALTALISATENQAVLTPQWYADAA